MSKTFGFAILATLLAPVASGAAPTHTAQALLAARFDAMQAVVRAGQPHYAVKIVAEDQSIHSQQGDGVVRIPLSAIRSAKSTEMLDMLLLLGLSQATYNPQRAERKITGTARTAIDALAYFGQAYATRGHIDYDQVGQRRPENEIDKPPSLRPAQRALIWAKTTGGCEARLIVGLNAMAKPQKSQLSRDAQQTLAALGSAAWSPDTRCSAPRDEAAYQTLIDALPVETAGAG
jgi:hypothetical protein